jgi:hypothetical protein
MKQHLICPLLVLSTLCGSGCMNVGGAVVDPSDAGQRDRIEHYYGLDMALAQQIFRCVGGAPQCTTVPGPCGEHVLVHRDFRSDAKKRFAERGAMMDCVTPSGQ